MNKFSELIANGVAKFEYIPIASNQPEQCPVCRAYNNTFGLATDTHMSILDDGRMIITGHIISDNKKFDRFLYSSMYGGVNFCHSGYWSLSDFLYKHNLVGQYDVLNGDNVYILTQTDNPLDQGGTVVCTGDCACTQSESFVTNESIIPQNIRFLSRNCDVLDITECRNENPYKMAQSMNESKDVFGNNWLVTNLSDGVHIVGYFNNKTYIL